MQMLHCKGAFNIESIGKTGLIYDALLLKIGLGTPVSIGQGFFSSQIWVFDPFVVDIIGSSGDGIVMQISIDSMTSCESKDAFLILYKTFLMFRVIYLWS